MTKQGEIREELACRRYYDGMVGVGSGVPKWEDRTEAEREYFRAKIDVDFRYLHSQDVMIKYEKCIEQDSNGYDYYETITESLIEE